MQNVNGKTCHYSSDRNANIRKKQQFGNHHFNFYVRIEGALSLKNTRQNKQLIISHSLNIAKG